MASADHPAAPLAGRIALVAGATRGAGRGIARMALGEAGATVYCTGRSSRGDRWTGCRRLRRPAGADRGHGGAGRPAGGHGVAVRVDHAAAAEVEALAERACAPDHGRLDLLVIDFWGDYAPVRFGTPFWEVPLAAARATLDGTLWPHMLTLRALVPLMRRTPPRRWPAAPGRRGGRGHAAVLPRASLLRPGGVMRLRLTYALAEELARTASPSSACAPDTCAPSTRSTRSASPRRRGARRRPPIRAGYTRSRRRSSAACVAALAADPRVAARAGRTFGSWELARDYGIDDTDGTRPDFGAYFREHVGESPLPPRTTARWQVAVGPEGGRA